MEAAECAEESNFMQLSLIISQCNLSATTKSIMRAQVNTWMERNTVSQIDEIILRIYMLVSGVMDCSYLNEFFLNEVNICKSLDWKRVLAMHIWYATSDSSTLNEAIQLYTEGFENLKFYAKPAATWKESKRMDVYDVQYHMLLLYCNRKLPLDIILDPLTHSKSLIDYSLRLVIK